jgi:hypothetical protein
LVLLSFVCPDFPFLFSCVVFHDQLSPSFDWESLRRLAPTDPTGILEKPSTAASSRYPLSNPHNLTNLPMI